MNPKEMPKNFDAGRELKNLAVLLAIFVGLPAAGAVCLAGLQIIQNLPRFIETYQKLSPFR